MQLSPSPEDMVVSRDAPAADGESDAVHEYSNSDVVAAILALVNDRMLR